MPKTIITYGTFDLFHVGHVRILQRCRDFGERLIVGCSTDEFNRLKGKSTVLPFEQRVEILRACRYVDLVIPEERWDQKRRDIIRHNANILAMGDDWAGKFDELSDLCMVIYLPRTEYVSTTDIKWYVKKISEEKLSNVRETLELAMRQVEDL